RGTVSSHTVRTHGEIAVVPEVGAGGALVRGEAGTEQACRKRGDFRGGDFVAVEGGPLTASRREKFFVDGVVNHGGEKGVMLRESQGDAEAGIAVSEIGGAIEGIDVPTVAGSGGRLVASAFFGGNGMVGE